MDDGGNDRSAVYPPPLVFGIYPGGATGTDASPGASGNPTESCIASGPPDDPERMEETLGKLQGATGRPFVVRGYISLHDPSTPLPATIGTPEGVERYAYDGRRLDLVVQFQSESGDVEEYEAFVRKQVRSYGSLCDTIQVTEEANVRDIPVLDGVSPRVREALVQGVVAAQDEARRAGHDHLQIGFNAVPSFGPGIDFWHEIGTLGEEPSSKR